MLPRGSTGLLSGLRQGMPYDWEWRRDPDMMVVGPRRLYRLGAERRATVVNL
ncbi:Hypothetical protein NGAL_HAMBI2610_51690 [Neorhizobium galegae bv. orientalis]|nr:Hypothetical protein NGAL_HAMBI2610_51690 [Neorhizobium galegae bv. orientalis]